MKQGCTLVGTNKVVCMAKKTFLSLQVNAWDILPSSNSTLNLVTRKLINWGKPTINYPIFGCRIQVCCYYVVKLEDSLYVILLHTKTSKNSKVYVFSPTMCGMWDWLALMTLGLKQSISRSYQWAHPPMPFPQMAREHFGLLRNIMMIFKLPNSIYYTPFTPRCVALIL